MDKLKALLEHYELDKYLGDLMTMGVFAIEDLCKLHDEDVLEILGSEENPDFIKLSNLISTVARRYKKEEPLVSPEPVIVEPVAREEEPVHTERPAQNVAQDSIPGRTLLGFAVIAIGVVLLFVGYNNERLYFDKMLMYFIGFIAASFVGAYLVKKELVSTPRNLVFSGALAVTAFSFYKLLCDGCRYGRIERFDLDRAGTGPIVFFVAAVIVTCILGWRFYKVDSEGESADGTSGTPAVSTDTDRIRWNTEIGGYRYRYAWFIAYIGMPCSAVLCAIATLNMFDTYDPDWLSICLFGGSAILSGIAACGLFRFKHYGYVCIILNYILGIILEAIIIFGQISIYNYSYSRYTRDAAMNGIVSGCISIFIAILCWVYFSHRKESFDK